MGVYFHHRWKRVQGIFDFTLLSIWWGFERLGVCILNFVMEISRD